MIIMKFVRYGKRVNKFFAWVFALNERTCLNDVISTAKCVTESVNQLFWQLC